MMEGVEFQLGASDPMTNAPRYPLTFDRRLIQGDRYREAAEELDASLQSTEEFFKSPNAGAHSGGPDCERCSKKKRRIMEAYYDYYLGNQPGRWDEGLLQYRQEMEGLFNTADIPLEVIHQRFQAELRVHLKNDLGTIQPADSENMIEKRRRTEELFEEGTNLKEPLEFFLQAKRMCHSDDENSPVESALGLNLRNPAGFTLELQNTKTAARRAQLYTTYYCTPMWNDSVTVRNLKSKYAKLFEEGLSHDTVLRMWRKEASDIKSREVERLKHRLGELQMAQSAHLKNKAKKMEKNARVKDGEYIVVSRLVQCSLRGCGLQIDAGREGGVLECAICDWLARKDGGRRRFYYCSEQHVDEDFDEHDRNNHACIMGNHCYYSPMTGPPGETGVCGICPDCADNDIVSYFCSQECYGHNLEAHREMAHYGRGIENRADELDSFRPEPDLEIVFS